MRRNPELARRRSDLGRCGDYKGQAEDLLGETPNRLQRWSPQCERTNLGERVAVVFQPETEAIKILPTWIFPNLGL